MIPLMTTRGCQKCSITLQEAKVLEALQYEVEIPCVVKWGMLWVSAPNSVNNDLISDGELIEKRSDGAEPKCSGPPRLTISPTMILGGLSILANRCGHLFEVSFMVNSLKPTESQPPIVRAVAGLFQCIRKNTSTDEVGLGCVPLYGVRQPSVDCATGHLAQGWTVTP